MPNFNAPEFFPSRHNFAHRCKTGHQRPRTISIDGGFSSFLFLVHLPPMADQTIDVRYVAKLARIDLSEDEITRFGEQLGTIMTHIDKLSEVDIEGIEATSHATQLSNKVRKDEPVGGLKPGDFLQNAPDQAKGQLRVPKVVDA